MYPTVQGKVKWAIAGRNESKLLQVKQDMIAINPSCEVSAMANKSASL